MNTLDNLNDFIGKNTVFAIGVVEDVSDPLTLGRVKARYFGYHTADKSKIPTIDLPWSQVLQSSASTSGVGFSPNYLKPDSWVFAIFMDGETAQFPVIMGAIPRIHDVSNPASFIGNSGAGYRGTSSLYSGDAVGPNTNAAYGDGFSPMAMANPGGGSVIADDGSHLTKQNIPHWPLKVYKPTPALGDYGLACKDGNHSLFIHYASALALEELGRRFGKNPGINSAYRTPAYNASVGGAKNSQHMKGRAFDVSYASIGGSSQANLARFAQTAVQCGFVGFGLYNSFIHIDTGSGRVWNGAKAGWFVNAIKQAGWYPGKPGLKDVRTSNAQTTPSANNNVDSTTTGSVSNDQELKRQAIKNIESNGGNYGAVGNVVPSGQYAGQRAYGAYQVMEGNIGPWTRQYYGTALTTQEFLNNPAAQDAVFDGEFGRLERATGSPGKAAQAWFGGLGSVGRTSNTDVNGMSIGQYEQKFNNYYLGQGGTNQVANGQSSYGFSDASGSLPYGGYTGKPSTHHNAVGLNGNLFQPEITRNNDARLTGFPVSGDKGSVGEPEVAAAPQYPYNYVYASLTGHMWEMDDTPGVERVNFQHKNGSRMEMGTEGTVVVKAMGNYYSVAGGSSYTLTMGAYNLSAVDDIDIRSTSDVTLHADGSFSIIANNDSVETVAGKKDMLVGETMQIKAKRLIIEAENIDFVSSGNITMEAGGNMSVRAGGTFATSSKDAKINASGSFDADAGSMGWLEGKTKAMPEMTAKSTDLGKAPKRAVIEKGRQRPNSDNTAVTTGDAMAHYGKSDPTRRTA